MKNDRLDRTPFDIKIESVRRCLKRVKEKTPKDEATFLTDIDAQDIVSLNLERATQGCIDLASLILASIESPVPNTFRESFKSLAQASIIPQDIAEKMCRACGFCNILVHEYQSVDWKIVYAVAQKHSQDYVQFIRLVNNWLDQRDQ